jgi:putative addiction module component (TIGR02574 family)
MAAALTKKKLQSEVMKLPLRDRAKLIKRLIESVDSEEEESAKEAWLVEARRRYEQVKNGKARTESAESAFKRARAALR